MKARIKDIIAATDVLAAINISKVSEKTVKQTLYNDYLYLRRIRKDAEEERREIVDKFQEDFGEEVAVVNVIRQRGGILEGHEAFEEAEKDANSVIQKLFEREVEVETKTISWDAFTAAVKSDLTLEQMAALDGFVID